MRLIKARVQNYRSILDSGEFEIERLKTILVGPNEAGKTVLLKALQQLNKPDEVLGFEALRDYPRSLYNEITTGNIEPSEVTVVTGYFELEDSDKVLLPDDFKNCTYKFYRKLDNKGYHTLENAPAKITFKDIKNDLVRLVAHLDSNYKSPATVAEGAIDPQKPSEQYKTLITAWSDISIISDNKATKLKEWLDKIIPYIEEGNEKEEARHALLLEKVQFNSKYDEVVKILSERMPIFILFNNYFRVQPSIHLEHLAHRTENNLLDDAYYDYGNLCLLKLLGFTPRELSNLGKTQSPPVNNPTALKTYKDALDSRSYQLNAASVRLTNEIRTIWMPNPDRPEADKLKVTADGQYLKVVVEDDLGVDCLFQLKSIPVFQSKSTPFFYKLKRYHQLFFLG